MAKLYHVRGSQGPRRVFLAIPTYDAKLHGPCLYSLLQSLPELEKAGISADIFILGGNCHVDDARNGCVREFLLTDCQQMVFIDADVGFRPQDLVKLISYERDVVAGVYPKKDDEEEYPVHFPPGVELWADADGLLEVHGAPTGFMKIRRSAIEKMCEFFKEKQYYGQSKHDKNKDVPYTILFERTFDQGYRLSGDYAFCFKWRFLGGQVFVDPFMGFTHEGSKEWGGCLGDYLKRKNGVYETQFAEAIQRLKAGRVDAETLQWLVLGWGNPYAAQVSLLFAAWHAAKRADGPILECGSGLSTIVMALANPKAHVHALEHDPIWASKVTQALAKHGIENVTVHLAPLVEYPQGRWYQMPELPADFALVLNDGPARAVGNREVFYTAIGARLNGAPLLVDDADDESYLTALVQWSQANGRKVETMGEERVFAISTKVH